MATKPTGTANTGANAWAQLSTPDTTPDEVKRSGTLMWGFALLIIIAGYFAFKKSKPKSA